MTTPAAQLQQFLQDNIPLAKATGATVAELSDAGLSVHAPLAPNSNHHGTAFGGSLYVVALAAGWGLTYLLLREAEIEAALFVQHAEADYLAPVTGELHALAERPSQRALNSFIKALRSNGRARLQISINMHCNNRHAFALKADFAARVPGAKTAP